jgi:WD40 repeat protein
MDSQERLTRDSGQQLDELCDRFEKAWQSGQAPEVSQFLASRAEQWQQWEPAKLLEDLIRLDLIYRWQLYEDSRQTAAVAELETLQTSTKDSQRRFLEDYIRQHPELGSSGQLALELVLEEYRVRHLWGDRQANVKIWDAYNGQEILTLQGHTASVTSSLFSPDGKRVASGSEDQTVKVWSAETGQEIMTLRGHRGYVTSLAFSPDGKRLASGSHDKTIKIWGELMRSQPASADAQP